MPASCLNPKLDKFFLCVLHKTLNEVHHQKMQTWTNQNINQTTKFNTWCRADRWDEGRCALCLPPLPFSAAPDEIKGMNRQRNWESCSTNPPTQSAATTKALWQELEAEQYNHSLILANPAGVHLIWVLCSKAPQWQKTEEQPLLLFFTSLEFYPAELAWFEVVATSIRTWNSSVHAWWMYLSN